ncbi:MAG: 50S ribosomal protein L13 [Candidatus Nanoarchaeia archaeon]|jgi:large subunit ribosomal protein L13
MKVIDGTNAIAGRLASTIAKMALQGETIRVVNAEKVLISGNPLSTVKDFTERIHRGNALKGPYQPRRADRLFKRIIRGMLPYKKDLGEKAFKRIKTYLGVPTEFEGKVEVIKNTLVVNSNIIKYITLETLSKRIGGRQ